MKLNLGCGDDIRDGYVNVDHPEYGNQNADLSHDLDTYPWPWAEDAANEILMSHVLEHLDSPYKALQEAARVLRGEGS